MNNKVLLSAFACEPGMGSEQGNGWNWALGLAQKGYEVHCLTRSVNRPSIETYPEVKNLHFHYVAMPLGTEALYSMTAASIYLHYMLWQYLAYIKGRSLHKKMNFGLVQHVTWGSTQMGSYLYKLNAPFIFGPAGGGQKAPEAFKKYFKHHWMAEEKREKVSNLLIKYNMACKKMLRKAHVVLAANPDTLKLAQNAGARNVHFSLDNALPQHFFPDEPKVKEPKEKKLKLLWVGRFMPRKGVLLLLEVMKELKDTPGITLTLVGFGEMEQDIKDYISANELSDAVKLTGRVPYEQVKVFYDIHDVFFFTSLRDSCPAQLLEAMAYGMPVITLDLHGQSILVNEQTGIRCSAVSPEKTINELKDAIIRLYQNPELVSEMSGEALKFARKQTWPEKINTIIKDHYPVTFYRPLEESALVTEEINKL